MCRDWLGVPVATRWPDTATALFSGAVDITTLADEARGLDADLPGSTEIADWLQTSPLGADVPIRFRSWLPIVRQLTFDPVPDAEPGPNGTG